MIWKRRWLALICWIVASAASLAVVRMLPSIYQSQAIVLVDSQKIPENFVTSTVNGDVADRLALISQDIMSSSRLLEIIRAYDLYKAERRTNTQEEILRQMHNDISISVEKSWTGGRMQAFRLGYQGRDPKVVTEVTNRLAGLYVAENARARESQAEGTVVFLRKQLAESKKSLSAQETKVTQFKQEHNGTLPQQENSLLSSLSSLRVELQGVQDGINRSQENKVSLCSRDTRVLPHRSPSGAIGNRKHNPRCWKSSFAGCGSATPTIIRKFKRKRKRFGTPSGKRLSRPQSLGKY
jgi:uncharacterized protein involved in exopolysaccharide biosynthesis